MGKRSIVRKAEGSFYRYFLRTSKWGQPLGDTSDSKGFGTDFVYKHDRTCQDGNDPRNRFTSTFDIYF